MSWIIPYGSRCLVTGGHGFIGSHIVERLLNDGCKVTVIDDHSAVSNESFVEFPGASNYVLDIRDPATACLYENVDYVFHLAARARIQPTIEDPSDTFMNNTIGTQIVLEHSRRARVKRVIYSASSSVYGRKNWMPLREDQRTDCLNPYSLSKLQGEELCELYARLYGLPTVVLRYFNVYGPREPLKGEYAPVIGIFKKQRDAGKPLTVVGTGEKRRDFTYVLDVVEANVRAALCVLPEREGRFVRLNVGTGKNYSVLDVARMVGGQITHISDRPAEALETLADVYLLEHVLEWVPSRDLSSMIDSY